MRLVFDVETDDVKASKLWCIVAQDVDTKEIFKFPPDKLSEACKLLSQADTLIGHNIIGFDIPIVEKFCNVDLSDKEVIDTLVLSRLFNPVRDGGHSLETWGYKLGYPKIQFEEYDKYSEKMLDYCVRDVELNTKVFFKLRQESKGFSKQSIQLEKDVARIIKQQEVNGFKFDMTSAQLLLAELREKMQQIEDEVHSTFKPKWIDDKLITPYIRKDGQLSKRGLTDDEYNRCTPTGQPIVDEKTLSQITHIHEAKLIADFLLLQKRIAQVDSWVEAVEEDDRVHGFVIPNGTITGRMTHRNPNMAQVPSVSSPYGDRCRACWTVDEGNVLLGVDASGLEIRMLAHYMADEEFINEIIKGDIHTTNQKAARLKSRNQAKTFIYALMYGAGDKKLGSVVGGNEGDGKRAREHFFSNTPSFKSLRDRVQRAAIKTYLKGIDGRKLYVRNNHAALNTLLQGAGSIVMKKALSLLDSLLRLNAIDYKFVANIHDEWQIEVKESQADFVGGLAVKSIIDAGKHFNLRCPLDGEYKIGDNWSETH